MEIIEAHPDKHWDWASISQNPNITMEMIEAHPNKDWCWYVISSNPNITMDFIERNIDKIDWINLSMIKLCDGEKEDTYQYYKQRKTQTLKQTNMIKEELIAETWHPDRFMEWCVDNEELKEIEETFGK